MLSVVTGSLNSSSCCTQYSKHNPKRSVCAQMWADESGFPKSPPDDVISIISIVCCKTSLWRWFHMKLWEINMNLIIADRASPLTLKAYYRYHKAYRTPAILHTGNNRTAQISLKFRVVRFGIKWIMSSITILELRCRYNLLLGILIAPHIEWLCSENLS